MAVNTTELHPSVDPTLNSSFTYQLYFDYFNGTVDPFHLGDIFLDNTTEVQLYNGTLKRVPNRRMSYPRNPVAEVMFRISFYTHPIIFVVGLLSNILAYLVFTRTRLRKVPSVPYLAAMAVVDSGALVTDFLQSGLVQQGVDLITRKYVCQYVTFFHFIFLFLCMWYPVALCVEKFISVYCPLRKANLCTPFRAKCVIISMFIFTGVCYYYIIYFVGTVFVGGMNRCNVWSVGELKDQWIILMKMNAFFVSLLPNITLIVLMALICFKGCEYYRISTAATAAAASSAEVSGRTPASRTRSTRSSSSVGSPYRVTNVIFPVVLTMMGLKFPFALCQFYQIATHPPDNLIKNISVFLYMDRLSLAVKLVVYIAFSPSFRRRTRSFLCNVLTRLRCLCLRREHADYDEEEVEFVGAGRGQGVCINLSDRGRDKMQMRGYPKASDV